MRADVCALVFASLRRCMVAYEGACVGVSAYVRTRVRTYVLTRVLAYSNTIGVLLGRAFRTRNET